MMKSIVLGALSTVAVSADPMCCTTCPNDLIKTYSIDPNASHCGESCIKESDFWKYHIFEKWLTRAETANPCIDHGYINYWETTSHGIPHLLSITVDLWNQTAQAESIPEAQLIPEFIIM